MNRINIEFTGERDHIFSYWTQCTNQGLIFFRDCIGIYM